MIYLASPYTHPEPEVMEQRFDAACRAAGALMAKGLIVFSPIAHTHGIAVRCELPRGWDFWAKFDREFVERAECVIVLRLAGWETSRGVAAELRIAEEAGIPIEYMDP
jgi:sugar phosphate isomerase/epimerase